MDSSGPGGFMDYGGFILAYLMICNKSKLRFVKKKHDYCPLYIVSPCMCQISYVK